VAVEDAGIEHADDDIGGFAANLPGGGGADIGTGFAAILAGVVETPLAGGEARVVGDDEELAEIVGLDVVVGARGSEAFDDLEDILGAIGLEHAEAAETRVRAEEADAGGGFYGGGGLGRECGVRVGPREQGAGAVAEAGFFSGDGIGVDK
jgi:hypothetical protein